MREEHGAVAVLVAILMVALMGFAAIGVDVANMASDKQQLQNGADAGALAVAQNCLAGSGAPCATTACTEDAVNLASSMADANRNDSATNPTVTGCVTEVTDDSVTVKAVGETDHWFAGILGTPSTPISAVATCSLLPYCGGGELPLVVSSDFIKCLMESTIPTETPFRLEDGIVVFDPPSDYVPKDHVVEIYLPQWADPKDPTSDIGGCYSAIDGNWMPGGFGWLDTVPDECKAETYLGAPGEIWNDGKPGAAPPTDCKGQQPGDALPGVLAAERPILIPLFDTPPTDPGNNGTYVITGFVAFHLVGYDISTSGKVNAAECKKACVRGYFDKAATMSGQTCEGAPDLGTYVIKLTQVI